MGKREMADDDTASKRLKTTGGADDVTQNAWLRPSVTLNEGNDALIFQSFDTSYYNDAPHVMLRQPGMPSYPSKVGVIKMYGVTGEGNSVLAHVHGFQPYFYVNLNDKVFSAAECEQFKTVMNQQELIKKSSLDHGVPGEAIVAVECIEKQSLWGYRFGKTMQFLKVTTAVHNIISSCRKALSSGVSLPHYGNATFSFQTYESSLSYVLRFMIDLDLSGACWVELPKKAYCVRPDADKTSYCQLEVDVVYKDLISHTAGNEWLKMAPFRTLSFDIECAARKNTFPDAQLDPVIQIANVICVQGQNDPILKNVFTLNSCAPIAGAHVHSFDTEEEMLNAWRDFVIASDPDILTGYNIINFDLPYLINRSHVFRGKCDIMRVLGRERGSESRMRDSKFSSRAYGTRESKDITIQGRIQFDLLPLIQREYKLRSYTLNAVSAEFLQQQKEDVHYSIITDLQNGTPETRRRLAVYCLKDAMLPQRLIAKLMLLINTIEMARVTGVPIAYLLTRGQQIKVISQLYRNANAKGFLVPVIPKSQSDESFEGATVFEPVRGYYTTPIATLDFSSLYPSIMMAHNLCYTTLLDPSETRKLDPSQYVKSPTGHYFVKADVQTGILPEILKELLAARKRAKRDMKNAEDSFTKAVLNGRQLALKISANSVYGFTGATVGELPCLAISASVTSFGRNMIEETMQLVEKEYCVANGHARDAKVIYGDTDSVMVNFGTETVAEAMELGKEAASKITEHFIRPINLEFEKVYYPYLLMNKKRYAGLYWTDAKQWSKLDAKGIESIRRDNCSLVKTVVETVLDKILVQRSVDDAVEYVKGVISDLLQNRTDLSELVISKSLSKSTDSNGYKVKMAHVELARRMQKRDPGSAPHTGDRVPYVITKAAKKTPAYERAEDPIYVLEHNLAIDTKYYLENQLSLPLTRIFEPILGSAKAVLEGDHTRHVKVASSTTGIMQFAVKKRTCMGCKVPLSSKTEVVCKHCKSRIGELYLEQSARLRTKEQLFSELWTECQRCQESLHQEVLCSNRDCPIFYRRKKVQVDLAETRDKLERFSIDF